MILHCTPPYRYDIPNAALGYLKGFLESKGIQVKNVYWNVILSREIQEFNKGLQSSSGLPLFSVHAITLHVWRHLIADPQKWSTLPQNPFFSSFLSRGEQSQLVHMIKDKIDRYIIENNLHTTSCAGFTMKSQQWLMSAYIISRLKEMNPDLTVAIGGITNKSQGRTYMRVFPLADYAIWGEGEYPLYYLVKALKEGTPLNEVPQLIYRDGTDICSTHKTADCPDLDSYPFADHTDYFETLHTSAPGAVKVHIPIWGSRACPWNKCKFCVLNEEYTYRARSPENIAEEIEYQSRRHNNDTFIFVDTEVAGTRKRFKTLLNLLVHLSAARNEPYHFVGDLSPIFIDHETIKSMRRASFDSVQVGFEALTDTLLEKMQKRHRFAYNIQVLKLGNRYQQNMDGLNIIRGIPTETAEDILESCQNVRFLRFFLNTYRLDPTPLALYKGSPFYEEMSDAEREPWNYHQFWTETAPTTVIPESDRFEFFGFFNQGSRHRLWDNLDIALKFYAQQNCSYTWIEYENGSFIEEKGLKTYGYTLDRDETDILIFCDVIHSFDEVKSEFSHIDDNRLRETLYPMKDAGVIYYDRSMHTIISVVDASRRESIWGHES
jgi:tRNA A37 methylthiotransferase MiaB